MIGFVEDAHCFQAVFVIMGCDLATSDRGSDYYRKEVQLIYSQNCEDSTQKYSGLTAWAID